ncbi:hypothetical protein C8J57DRAFT_1226918 [Mycena rebaudengoi]|nr:hypothetical protein C8J57DRAFT_1226918 [Mycena rebaudengoi]
MWVLGSEHRKQIFFWCLDPATRTNISVGAWICAPKRILALVPGSSRLHKYFCGCLDLRTEKDIDFGAWIQPPAQIFMWVLGSRHRKQCHVCSRHLQEYYRGMCTPNRRQSLTRVEKKARDAGTQCSLLHWYSQEREAPVYGKWEAVFDQLWALAQTHDNRGSIPSATGVLLKIKFFRKKFYYVRKSKIPVFRYLRIFNANRMSLFLRETVEN